MTYLKYTFYLNYLRRDTGFKDKLISYYFRRGYANAINSIYSYIIL
jgi:hypothetical protein